MKKIFVILIISMYILCLPLPRTVEVSQDDYKCEKVKGLKRTPKIAINQFQKQKPIEEHMPFVHVLYELKRPVMLEEYKHVVVKPKFRPQSARIMVDESAQKLYLKKQNKCSIMRTGNFV